MKKSFFALLTVISLVYKNTDSMQQTQKTTFSKAEIVQILIKKKRNETEPEAPLSVFEELYPLHEKNLDNYKKHFPKYALTGGITYLMSLDEIATIIQAHLEVMRSEGKILTEEEFAELNKDEWVDQKNNLTRVWGGQFLQKEFQERGLQNHKVPEYILVVKDLKNIQIKIWFGRCFPIATEILNGNIYAKKIVGKPSGRQMGITGADSRRLGYTKYSDPSIVETQDGSKYFIDTQYDSFYDGNPASHFLQNRVPAYGILCSYLEERFKLTNHIDFSPMHKDITLNLRVKL